MPRFTLYAFALIANALTLHGQDSSKFSILAQTINATCHNSDDAVITLILTEGMAPAVVQWENQTASLLGANIIPYSGVPLNMTQLKPGNYQIYVSNTLGMDTSFLLTLNAPQSIDFALSFEAETCFGANTGMIEMTGITGGVPPYSVRVNDAYSAGNRWENLAHGSYFVELEDAIGCIIDEGVILPSGLEFEFDLGPDIIIFTGDTLFGAFDPKHTLGQISWEPTNCCQFNLDGSYWVSSTNDANIKVYLNDEVGCGAVDDLLLSVKRRRDIYAPNIFSPNDVQAAPENQRFSLYANGGIATIEWMQVGDRHGQRWFDRKNIAINDSTQGWDGQTDGRKAPAGVYLWAAKVRYTDGRSETLAGDVTLVR